MHLDGYLILGSALVGLLVGLTGAGGGALMTPMLIFFFGVSPSAAISSDLVATIVMRPFGAAVHVKRKTVNFALVGWLATGAVPAALAGAYTLKLLGASKSAEKHVELVLGVALLLGAAAMLVRAVVRRRRAVPGSAPPLGELGVRPLLTVGVGVVGGFLVGLTSVGAGSLMIVLLLLLYPTIGASQLVGTDLVQAIPLTAAAALGQLLWGHVELAVTASVIVGSVPAVVVGSLISSRAPTDLLRPVITGVLVVSGLKYVGLPTGGLEAAIAVVAVVVAVIELRLYRARDASRGRAALVATTAAGTLEGAGAGVGAEGEPVTSAG